MNEAFDRDLARCRADLDAARRELLSVVTALKDDNFEKAPRGQWPVKRILEHIIWHEEIYVRFISHIRGRQGSDMPDCTPSNAADAVERLAQSRKTLLAGVDGVDEETFYRLAQLGPEEYSVLSMLENEANHEREHAAQIRRTVNP